MLIGYTVEWSSVSSTAVCLSVQTLSLLTYEWGRGKELCLLDIQLSRALYQGQLCVCLCRH